MSEKKDAKERDISLGCLESQLLDVKGIILHCCAQTDTLLSISQYPKSKDVVKKAEEESLDPPILIRLHDKVGTLKDILSELSKTLDITRNYLLGDEN